MSQIFRALYTIRYIHNHTSSCFFSFFLLFFFSCLPHVEFSWSHCLLSNRIDISYPIMLDVHVGSVFFFIIMARGVDSPINEGNVCKSS
ncbi:hypothetical protein EDD16DRAFT_684373 [Pisolithus croceorrhizus]|nr:hypothetical protein EDD16DRAFT_684373 [Pisolithus croceorrhizus]KAI6125286.1 hypothetical protein EV401DRAFT_1115814 [Pisolithus croceorrhizus]KAI6158891.1 hypothetical protein EDD17DRAFT_966320 [Pisolithus thermaeus]